VRGWHVAKFDREQARHSCGLSREVCADPERTFYPQRIVCYATMEQQAAEALYERLHHDRPWHDGTFEDWAAEPSTSHPYHISHGVTIVATERDFAPDDDFLSVAQHVADREGDDGEQPESGAEG
jgi:hypothetical protein